MKLLVALALVVLASTAHASPCAGVDRRLTEERKKALAPVLRKQLLQLLPSLESVDVVQSFHVRNWYIIEVETHISDQSYLFYDAEPTEAPYLTVWGGSVPATEEEYRSIVDTLSRGKTRGIPKALANCFAWHMTKRINQ